MCFMVSRTHQFSYIYICIYIYVCIYIYISRGCCNIQITSFSILACAPTCPRAQAPSASWVWRCSAGTEICTRAFGMRQSHRNFFCNKSGCRSQPNHERNLSYGLMAVQSLQYIIYTCVKFSCTANISKQIGATL